MMYGWDGSGWGIVWMVVSMVVVWGTIFSIIALLLRTDGGRRPKSRDADATELLRRRFADGDIPNEEYQERLRILEEARY